MMAATIRTRLDGRIGVLTLNRPSVLNAINGAMVREINQAMADFVNDPQVLAIVIHGEGRAFSAGFDLKESAERQVASIEEWRALLDEDFAFIMQFWDCPKPTIAAVHGHCIAGAFEVMLACDIAVAAEGTYFGEPEVRFGAGIVALLLPWMTTPKIAKELLLTGNDKVSATQAREMGMVNHVVPPGTEFAKAMSLAADVCAAAPVSVQLTKRAINRTYEMMNMRQALLAALETSTLISSGAGPERVEFSRIAKEQGLTAAIAWRNGRFK
jgi:enoyl-CoA hydratase